MRTQVVHEICAAVDERCDRLGFGVEPGEGVSGWGLRGLLAAQRSRPLFSGVRNQVLDLHRYARDAWGDADGYGLGRIRGWRSDTAMRQARCCRSPRWLHIVYPKMTRFRVYDDPTRRLTDLLEYR